MEEELVNPNWHVALVHFPIALLIIGTFIESTPSAWYRAYPQRVTRPTVTRAAKPQAACGTTACGLAAHVTNARIPDTCYDPCTYEKATHRHASPSAPTGLAGV